MRRSSAPSGWTFDTLKQHYDERIAWMEQELIRDFDHLRARLDGFPEEYASRHDNEALRKQIETIRSDHVQRREFDTLRDSMGDSVTRREYDDIRQGLAEATGRRTAVYALAGIAATGFAIVTGVLWKQQLTHGQVSDQIKTEAPWLSDRPLVEHEIAMLQQETLTLRLRINSLEAIERQEAAHAK